MTSRRCCSLSNDAVHQRDTLEISLKPRLERTVQCPMFIGHGIASPGRRGYAPVATQQQRLRFEGVAASALGGGGGGGVDDTCVHYARISVHVADTCTRTLACVHACLRLKLLRVSLNFLSLDLLTNLETLSILTFYVHACCLGRDL